jgi:hypothetical protein
VGNYPSVQGVTGTVDIGNYPSVQGVTGFISISNGSAVTTVNSVMNDATKKGVDSNSFLMAYNRTTGQNSYVSTVTPAFAGASRILETNSYLSALNVNNQAQTVNITSTLMNSSQCVDTYVSNATTSNNFTKSGLNVYNIYPKKLSNILSGSQGGTTATGLFYGGPVNNTMTFGNNYPAGGFYFATGWRTGNVLNYDYVNSSGNIVTAATTMNGATSVALAGGASIKCLLKMYSDIDLVSGNFINISVGSTTYSNSLCIAGMNYGATYNGVIVVPNGYIGYFQYFNFYANAATDVTIAKYLPGVPYGRVDMFKFTQVTNLNLFSPNLFGIWNPGESVVVAKMTAATTSSSFSAHFVLEAV